jgi:hypothetical protein
VHSGVTNMTDRHEESKFVWHDGTVPLAINVVYGDDAFIFERIFDLGQILGPAREYHALDGIIPAPIVTVVKNGLHSGQQQYQKQIPKPAVCVRIPFTMGSQKR